MKHQPRTLFVCVPRIGKPINYRGTRAYMLLMTGSKTMSNANRHGFDLMRLGVPYKIESRVVECICHECNKIRLD